MPEPGSSAPEPSAQGAALLATWVSALAALAAFALIAPLLWLTAPAPPPVEAVLSQLVTDPKNVLPEPAESRLYAAGAVFVLAFLLAWCAWALPRVERLVARRPRAVALGAGLVTAALAVAALAGDGAYHLHRLMWFEGPGWALAAVAIAGAAALPLRGRAAQAADRALRVVLPAFLLLLTVAGGIFLRDDPYPRFPLGGHFEVLYFSLVKVFEGAPLLNDSGNQYGLHAHFLVPLFRVLGLGVVRASAVFALLAAGFLAMLLVLLWSLVRRPWIAVGVWAAGVATSFHFGQFQHQARLAESLGFTFHDPYFQYNPVRTLFPGAVLLVALRLLGDGRRRVVRAGLVIASAGVLWNLDSGAVAWLALLAFLAYQRLEAAHTPREAALGVARELAEGAAALALVLVAFTASYRLAYGFLPQWSRFAEFQRVFYGSGFFMLPMPLPGAWMLVILAYVLGLAWSVRALFRPVPTEGPAPSMVFLLSVLGVGLFSYYQGRSHPDVLLPCSYPAWILAALLLDAHAARLQSAAARFALGLVLGAPVLGAAALVPGIAAEVHDRIGYASSPGPHPMDGDFEFVRQQARDGRLLVLSDIASIYYQEADRAPAFSPSLPELVQRPDVDRLTSLLRDAPGLVVIVDRDFLQVLKAVWPADHPLHRALDGYRAVAASPSGMVLRLARRTSP